LRELGPLARPVLLLVVLVVVGSAGYVLIEGYPLLDAVFMTVTTLATVGYGEIHPLGPGGRLFTTILILVGVGSALFTLTELVRFVYEGQLGQALWRRRMDRRLKELSNHFILCGYGRVGRQIAADLEQSSVPFVVIDRDPVGLRLATERGLMVVEGDAGSDDVLRMAGVEQARGLVTAVAEDADNIYVTLSARALNSGLRIVARANAEESISKLQRAGADQVVSPYSIGGRRLAMLALRPLSVEFVDAVFHGETGDLLLEDMELVPGSRLVGRSIDDVQTVLAPGVSVLALKRDSAILARPPGDTSLMPGDELVVIGTQDQLGTLERMG
jgi:voltage-gated potassium channel